MNFAYYKPSIRSVQARPMQMMQHLLVVMWLLWVYYVLYFVDTHAAVPPHPRFLISPKPHCTPLGTNVTFRCRVRGDVPLHWCTTGAAARCNARAEFANTSSSYSYRGASNVKISRLHVTASTHYNGSRFKCCYYRYCSGPAKLTVVWPGEHACLCILQTCTYRYLYFVRAPDGKIEGAPISKMLC